MWHLNININSKIYFKPENITLQPIYMVYATCRRATIECGLNVSAIIDNQIKTDATHCLLDDVISVVAII